MVYYSEWISMKELEREPHTHYIIKYGELGGVIYHTTEFDSPERAVQFIKRKEKEYDNVDYTIRKIIKQ